MRKIIFSILALSFVAAAVSACSPSMVPTNDWQPRHDLPSRDSAR